MLVNFSVSFIPFFCVFFCFRYFGNTRNAFIEGKNEIRTGRLLPREKSQEFFSILEIPCDKCDHLSQKQERESTKAASFPVRTYKSAN